MIRYALACEHDHEFEGWFGASADYDDQQAKRLIECPVCGSKSIRKQIMAPAVAGTKRNTPDLPPEAPAPPQQERRHRGGLLGWLFGSGDDDDNAPPPPPRSDR